MHLSLHAPPTPGRAEVGISGDLEEIFDKFPHPGDDFMLQIPYKALIIPLVWGEEIQEIESKTELRSRIEVWNTGEKIVTSIVSVHLKLWVPLKLEI